MSDDRKNRNRDRHAIRRYMDRTAGAEASAVANDLFFGEIDNSDIADLTASITPVHRVYADFRAQLATVTPGQLDLGGFVRPVYPSTLDLPAAIQSFQKFDIRAQVIVVRTAVVADLPTALLPTHIKDLSASARPTPLFDLGATLQVVRRTVDVYNRSRYRGLTRKLMDRVSGVEVSEVANRLFFGETHGTGIADITANIHAIRRTQADIRAQVFGAAGGQFDLGAYVKPGTPSFEDLSVSIQSFQFRDLSAQIATLSNASEMNLSATLLPFHITDIPASIRATYYSDLQAVVQPFQKKDLGASLVFTQPEHIPAYIRSGFSGEADLGASIVQTGGFLDLPARVRVLLRSSTDLGASVKPRVPVDLRAVITGFATEDLGAQIGTQRIMDMRGIIEGEVVEKFKNLPAFLRLVDSAAKDLPVTPFHIIVSTHTSDKTPNLHKYSKKFNDNRFVFGSRTAGFFLLTVEPVFGIFPDLHASITPVPLSRIFLGAFLRVAHRQAANLPTTLTAVGPYINIAKVTLSPQPLKNLPATLFQRGQIVSLPAYLRAKRVESTSTSDDAKYVTTVSSYKFLIGTGRGLFIPENNVPVIRTTTFLNSSPRPDLRASIHGWFESNLGAWIKPYSSNNLPVYLNSIGPDRYKDLFARLVPAREINLPASIASQGYWTSLGASVNPDGATLSLGASIVSFINPLSFNVVAVSSKPFANLGAVINQDTFITCAPNSQVVSLGAYVKIFAGHHKEFSDFGAELNALHLTTDVRASVIPRKMTRFRIITLNFRAGIRASAPLQGIITPLVRTFSDMLTTVVGLSHEFDLPAEINPTRKVLDDVLITPSETVVNLRNPEDVREVLVQFRSKVSAYVWEDLTQIVYPTEHGTWALDLRTTEREESFFDRSPSNREVVISRVTEYHSIDAAIRRAVSILCDRQIADFSASILVEGKTSDLSASIELTELGRFFDLPSSLVTVFNSPDIGATINVGLGGSSFKAMSASIKARREEELSLPAEVAGSYSDNFGAEIVAEP